MESYIVFGVVAVIILLVGYFMYLVQQDRRNARHAEDAVAAVSQISSGSLAGAAVPQPDLLDDPLINPVDIDEEAASEYEIPVGLLVDYMLGLLAPETQELVKRKFAEQNCYLNPLKKDAEGRVDLNLFIDTPQGREQFLNIEGLKVGKPSPAGRELDERVKAVHERRPYKRDGDRSFQSVIGNLFESELDSLDERLRAEKEAAANGAQAPAPEQKPEVKEAPAEDSGSESRAAAAKTIAPPKPMAEPESGKDEGEDGGEGRAVSFMRPPQPESPLPGEKGGEKGETPKSSEEASSDEREDSVDPEAVYHQPVENEGKEEEVLRDDPDESLDIRSVFEDEEEAEGASGSGSGSSSVQEQKTVVEPAPEPSSFDGLPEDIVEILKRPNDLAVPYCMYFSSRFHLGIEYDFKAVRSDLAIPTFDEVRVICRGWDVEDFFPMLRNMQRTGQLVEDALAGAGLPGVTRPKGGKIVINPKK